VHIACPSCRHENRASARFCDECGTGLIAAYSRAQDRVVELRHGTFLFCDLVNSTLLANRLDLEDLRIVFRAFREVVGEVTRAHGGYLNRFVGDGAFVSFGYPVAREDAEESAVRAGLEMVRALRASKSAVDVELDLRVGIASGTVVVGEMIGGAAVSEESVIGSVPHLAARLLSEAPAGGVVVADATRRLAGRYFEYRDLGLLTLKGFDDGVQAWLVLGETSIASRFEAQRFGQSTARLVGRAEILVHLAAAWQRARAGSGQMVVLTGDAGIGKSRLARALYDSSRKAGARRFELDCTARTNHTPLYPISSLLRRLVGVRHADNQDARSRRLNRLLERVLGSERAGLALRYLGPLIGVEPTDAPLDESAERIRECTISTLIELVKAIGAQGPTLLLFEDMHWADATTVLFVQRISAELRSVPVLILATMRSSPDAPDIELAGASVVAIEPLDNDASAQLVRSTTGGELLTDQVVDRIVQRAEGNPLFLEELARAVVDQPAGEVGSGHPSAGTVPNVPASLQKVIEARLDRRPSLRPIVQAASVLGREFPMRLLRELLVERRAELPEAVARLVDLGLLTVPDRSMREHLRFKHALIHESVYQTMLRSERQQLHSRTAELLVQHFDGLPESAPDVLAHHLAAAHRFEEAVRALVAASGETARRAAYLESVGYCRSGLALIAEVSDPRVHSELKLELLTHLGVALAATSGYATPEVEDAYRQARELCELGTTPEVLFPIVRGLGTFYFVRCNLASAAELSASCIKLAHEAHRTDFLIEALSFRGYTCVYQGQLAEGRAVLEECIDLYRTHGGYDLHYPSPQDAGTAAWSLLGIAAWLTGDTAGAEAAVSGALAHVERLGRPFDTAYAHVWIAMLRNMQRRFEEAQHHATICIEISHRHGFNTWLVAATMHACIAQASRIPSPESIATLRHMLGLFIQAGAEANAPFFLWGVAQGLRLIGDRSAAIEALDEALRRADATGESYLKSELLILAGGFASDDGSACAHFNEALTLAELQGAVPLSLRAALELLRRQGRSSDDPARDREALKALDGITPYPTQPDWALTALRAAKAALAH
jgi:class 3 adenylate cyclase/tetratricopeptide (TPR) repeat protein